MTDKFDKFVNSLITERYKRCTGTTLPELSDNPRYVFSRCAPNPYTAGFKRIYFQKRGEKLSLDKCKNDPVFGSAKYEECRLAKIAQLRYMRRQRQLLKSKTKK